MSRPSPDRGGGAVADVPSDLTGQLHRRLARFGQAGEVVDLDDLSNTRAQRVF